MGDKEQLDYSHVSKLTYLDMCISEALRIYPVAPLLSRAVNKAGVVEAPVLQGVDICSILNISRTIASSSVNKVGYC